MKSNIILIVLFILFFFIVMSANRYTFINEKGSLVTRGDRWTGCVVYYRPNSNPTKVCDDDLFLPTKPSPIPDGCKANPEDEFSDLFVTERDCEWAREVHKEYQMKRGEYIKKYGKIEE